MEITTYMKESGLPTSPNRGINGLTDSEKRFLPGFEIKKFTPKISNPFQSVILTPGFGHTIGVKEPFTNLASNLASILKNDCLLTVDDQRDRAEMLHWSFLPTGINMAIESAVNIANKPVHIIAFSRHSQPAVDACYNMLRDQDGFLASKIGSEKARRLTRKVGPIISLTLCAPAYWNSLRDLMEARNAYDESSDTNGAFIEIGKRKTRAHILNSQFKEWTPTHDDFQKYKDQGKFIVDHGVTCKVLIAKNDPIVPNEISINLARAFGFKYNVVIPENKDGSIHDFDDPKLENALVSAVQHSIIKVPREFDLAKEIGVVKKHKN